MSEVRRFRWVGNREENEFERNLIRVMSNVLGTTFDQGSTGGYDVEDGEVYFVQFGNRTGENLDVTVKDLERWAADEEDDLQEVSV